MLLTLLAGLDGWVAVFSVSLLWNAMLNIAAPAVASKATSSSRASV